jgi:hypothetical protein
MWQIASKLKTINGVNTIEIKVGTIDVQLSLTKE